MSAKVGVWTGVLAAIAIVITVVMAAARPAPVETPSFRGVRADLPAAGYGHLPPSPLLKPDAAESKAQRRHDKDGRRHDKA